MIIRHIPAGYIFGKYLIRKNSNANHSMKSPKQFNRASSLLGRVNTRQLILHKAHPS